VDPLSVPLSQLVDVAIEVWRIKSALKGKDGGQDAGAAAKYGIRKLSDFLASHGIEVLDLTGQDYEPGLAVEVVATAGGSAEAPDNVICETISPICVWQGRVVRHGQVVIQVRAVNVDVEEQPQ
jgi:hypothetical protein